MLRFVLIVFATSAIQGCATLNSTTPDSPIPNRPDPLSIVKSETPGPITPQKVHVGSASWYGPGFSGKKTASGDVFDETKFTAAHKTLPLGTRAKVTRLSNGKSVEVLINDRGPYIEGRIIDLSQAAAGALGIIDRGVVEVEVAILDDEVVAENTRDVDRR
jgi:rare lipoprotein A